MTVIRDYDIALQKIQNSLDKLKEKGSIKYSKVESVKIRNRYTRRQDVIKDLFFVSFGKVSEKPILILGVHIKGDENIYLLHDDVTHCNISNGREDIFIGIENFGVTLIGKYFCNPVTQNHIWDNPDTMSKILKGNLMEGNINDAYRQPESVDVNFYAPAMKSYGTFLNSKATLMEIVTGKSNITGDINSQRKFKKITDELLDNHELCYAYVSDTDHLFLEFSWRIIHKTDIENGTYIATNYYRKYDFRDVTERVEIQRIKKDVCCVGLGSAGSNILEQLGKTTYFKTYLLIDFDKVERKNLRNQIYTRNHVGGYKTTGVYKYLEYCSNGIPGIETIDDKYENVDFSTYEFKYIISGFDTIECRLGLLELIKKGTIKAEYLIDARYIDLESSLYVIDINNNSEMEYYEKLLLQDKEAFDNQPKNYDWSNLDDVRTQTLNIVNGECAHHARIYGLNKEPGSRKICHCLTDRQMTCGTTECLCILKEALEKAKVENKISTNSCLHENIIHIYKLTSAWVTSAIRHIETEDDGTKPFTHVEIIADPLPNAMIIKK